MLARLREILDEMGLTWFNRYYSIYEGEVTDNEDPEKLGRIKLKCDKIFGDQIVNEWARPRGQMAGKGFGLFAIPEKGDVVWVSFLEGDPRFPIWEYGYHYRGTMPTKAHNNGRKVTNKVWQTKNGHSIELDEKPGAPEVRVTHANGYKVVIDALGISIVVPTGKKIFLGSLDAAAEPGVLGDKNAAVLTDIKTLLTQIQASLQAIGTADTPGNILSSVILTGLAGSPVLFSYGATFTALSASMNPIIAALTAKILATKSLKVKTD